MFCNNRRRYNFFDSVGAMRSQRCASATIHAITTIPLIFVLLLSTLLSNANAVLYNDGQSHSISSPLNDDITLRSSSTLILPSGDYTIRSPAGSESAIRLYMSSTLNATGGDIFGADATEDHPTAGTGVIVGGASYAVFYDGVTVRGGNHLGGTSDVVTTQEVSGGGQGGDALISQYIYSNATIHGGSFIAGKGSIQDGHSLHAIYEGSIIHVYGGYFYGSWKVQDKGSIAVYGCVQRIGTRLVGQLENGHSLDVQVFEESEGKIVVNSSDEECNHYRKKKKKRDASSAAQSSVFLVGIAIPVLSLVYTFLR